MAKLAGMDRQSDAPPWRGTIDPVQVFRALGHRSRLRITEVLADREACVDELRAALGCSWSSVSQHLTVLRQAGIVASTRCGNRILYRLSLPCVATLTNCLTAAGQGMGVEVRTCCG